MNRETVIYYGGFVLPDKNAAANRVVSNGKLFSSLGYDTVFLGNSLSDSSFEGIKAVEDCENMFEISHPKSSLEWLRRMLSIKDIELLAQKYDNVKKIILYNVPFLTLIKAKLMFSKKNTEVLYDCTEWTKDTDGSFIKKIFKAVDEFFIRNFAYIVADGMIVISRMMAQKYKHARKLIILPPLVDIDAEIWHQKPDESAKNFEFCFAGIPDGNKESLDKAVEAFCSLNSEDAVFRIIGITEDDFSQIYPNSAIPVSARNRIIFMGKLSHRETVRYILSCGCYVFIRRSDRRNNAGFPTKFAEAFTCKVPIISTDVSDIGKYMSMRNDCILLKAISVNDIAQAMQNQLENRNNNAGKSPDSTFHYGSYTDVCKEFLN